MPNHTDAPKPVGHPSRKLTTQQRCCIGISGAFGAMLAVLADIVQKEQASAVTRLDDSLRSTLGVSLSPLIVVFLLLGFAVGLCYVFGVESTKSAFFRGASILAILMTATPYKVPPSIATSADQPEPTTTSRSLGDLLVPPVFAGTIAAPERFRIDVHLAASGGGSVPSAIYTLLKPGSKEVIARSNIQGSDFGFYVSRQSYVLRVEVPGYAIVERQINVSSPQSLSIALAPSSIPIAIQRVFRY